MAILVGDEETREVLRRVKEVAVTFGRSTPFSFCEQIEGYLKGLLQMEKSRIPYKARSPQKKARKGLVQFLMHIAESEKYCSMTLFHAVYLYDRFTDFHAVSPKQQYLVALTCLIIAAKLEENDTRTPKFKRLRRYMPVAAESSPGLFVAVERFILNYFDFKILVPTEVNFLELYMLFALDGAGAVAQENNNNNNYQVGTSGMYHCEISSKYYEQLVTKINNASMGALQHLLTYEPTSMHPPSLLAAAAFMWGRREAGLNFWTSRLTSATGYGIRQVLICLRYYIEPMIFANRHRPVFQDPAYIVSDKHFSPCMKYH